MNPGLVIVQPEPCVVCGFDRQVTERRPKSTVGRIIPCLHCCGPNPIPVLVVDRERAT